MSVVRFLGSACALVTVSIALQWAPTPKDGDIIYACVGDDVTFPWSYNVSSEDDITSIEWLFERPSQELMAMLSHGVFVPLPAFSGRVQQIANGGIVLSHVTAGDSGNYTLEVNLLGSHDVIKHTLILEVTSGLPTSDGHLHAHQQQDPVLDSTNQQWSLVLSCGHFIFLNQPAFSAEWLTPSGQMLPSSAYKDGYFDLHLVSPVEGGTYTCRVSQQQAAMACLHGNSTAAGQASVVVDKMEARMALMEAEVRALRRDKQQQAADIENKLRQEVGNLRHDLTSVDHRLSYELNMLQANMTSADEQLRQVHNEDNATLSRMIQDAKTPLISFNAQATNIQILNSPTHVNFDNVLYNAGQGYDNATGDFSAPLAGTYFFIFHTRSGASNNAYSHMYASGHEVCSAYINRDYNHGSCHAVVHLVKGDKVWMQPMLSGSYYSDISTSFAGFLIHADP